MRRPLIVSENLHFFDKKNINCGSKNSKVMIYLTISGLKRREQPAFLFGWIFLCGFVSCLGKEKGEAVL